MGMEVTGKLHAVFETKQVTDRFQKREFVVEVSDSKYAQHVLFQLTGDRCDVLDGLKIGDSVRVEFNLRGRQWTSPQGEVKYFNSLDAWRLERNEPGRKGGRAEEEPPPPTDAPADYEDIPF